MKRLILISLTALLPLPLHCLSFGEGIEVSKKYLSNNSLTNDDWIELAYFTGMVQGIIQALQSTEYFEYHNLPSNLEIIKRTVKKIIDEPDSIYTDPTVFVFQIFYDHHRKDWLKKEKSPD